MIQDRFNGESENNYKEEVMEGLLKGYTKRVMEVEKVEVKRKWWVLAQHIYYSEKKRKVVTRVETTGIDHLTQRTRGAGIVKSLDDK